MGWLKSEWKSLALIVAVFLAAWFLPVGEGRFDSAVGEALALTKWYAREHVLLCLVPAFFIAGAIGVFVRQAAVMRYLGPKANKLLAYGVASVSGSILAVCSCTVLPLFAGIWRMGAGLGPATAFLYSGPAINVLAIILTARVLGLSLGVARAVGAVAFSVVIGLLMHLIFRKEEVARAEAAPPPEDEAPARPLWKDVVYFAAMVGVLVFANWGLPAEASAKAGAGQSAARFFAEVHALKWYLTGACALALFWAIARWFRRDELAAWCESTWGFAKQILPLLLAGVLVSGFLLGRPGHEGMIPSRWVADAVGGNSLAANFFAALVGALMYFATPTEVPIVQGLIGSGMGKGPALALLLAGPALSLPSMLVLRSILGTKKTVVYCSLVVVMATATGLVYGAF